MVNRRVNYLTSKSSDNVLTLKGHVYSILEACRKVCQLGSVWKMSQPDLGMLRSRGFPSPLPRESFDPKLNPKMFWKGSLKAFYMACSGMCLPRRKAWRAC